MAEAPRPFAPHVPRRAGDALIFDLPGREVAVDGEPELLLQVLGRCDGRRTPAAIAAELGEPEADVAELLGELLAAGAVIEPRETWRVFHEQTSTHSALFGPVTDADLAAARRPRAEPADAGRVALEPAPSALAQLAERRSSATPADGPRAATFAELSAVVAGMYGRTAAGRRTVPSGGALEPLELHVLLAADLPPLGSGAWRVDAGTEGVAPLVGAEVDLAALFLPEPTVDGLTAAGGPVIVVSGDVGRAARKYQARAYRLVLLEAGAAMQNAYLVAAELELPVRAVAGFHDRTAARMLALPDGVVPLVALILGA